MLPPAVSASATATAEFPRDDARASRIVGNAAGRGRNRARAVAATPTPAATTASRRRTFGCVVSIGCGSVTVSRFFQHKTVEDATLDSMVEECLDTSKEMARLVILPLDAVDMRQTARQVWINAGSVLSRQLKHLIPVARAAKSHGSAKQHARTLLPRKISRPTWTESLYVSARHRSSPGHIEANKNRK